MSSLRKKKQVLMLIALALYIVFLLSQYHRLVGDLLINQNYADGGEQSNQDLLEQERSGKDDALDEDRSCLQKDKSSAAACGRLRRNWSQNPPLSDYAKQIEAHQSNCSLPLATYPFNNKYGFGSHLMLWGMAACNGMEMKHRIRSHAPEWLWLDQEQCDMEFQSFLSPMLCYFPASEYKCPDQDIDVKTLPRIPEPFPSRNRVLCPLVKQSDEAMTMVQAATVEYLFQSLSPIVIQEAKRQIGIIFPDGIVPEENLVTVHIRWGDKKQEMKLVSIDEYISGVYKLLAENTGLENTTTANIYLSTEDPEAYKAFMTAKPEGWNVYTDITLQELDHFRPETGNHGSVTAKHSKGRMGLVGLASLLVAMEANMFVLTTRSNW
eukprot:CAMPEP_0178954322 /NCGR_PEP_ID=MMETSP0789-20121207/8922_1 /TAXON_ID=3005 /ORGANISM="Rhizosolenia setigera, Strain CCMP 1694" /LENGTH=379 /DNA_ID=CAMNT_0020635703 /DNA_START=110 /DNA_END=1246 /DNA_ORIENTATION=-